LTEVGERETSEGDSEVVPLVVVIVLMILLCVLFGFLVYKEDKTRKENALRNEQEEENKRNGLTQAKKAQITGVMG
jgi:uncharacterized protein YxeA